MSDARCVRRGLIHSVNVSCVWSAASAAELSVCVPEADVFKVTVVESTCFVVRVVPLTNPRSFGSHPTVKSLLIVVFVFHVVPKVLPASYVRVLSFPGNAYLIDA